MKVNRICCFTAFAITLISVYLSPADGAVPRPPMYGPRGLNRGLNALGGYSGYGRNVQYVPVPVVKRVTHHHIHHLRVIPKGLGKTKLGGGVDGGYDGGFKGTSFDGGFKGVASYDGDFKGSAGFGGDSNNAGYGGLGEKGGNTPVNKRGGRFGGPVFITTLGRPNNGGADFGGAQAGNEFGKGMSGGIEGFIGDTKAEFVPVVIGLLDDEGKDSRPKNENSAYDSGRSYGQNADFSVNFGIGNEGFGSDANGKQFWGENYADGNRGYSSRKGLLRPSNSRSEYVPPRETVRLFEDLAKLGW